MTKQASEPIVAARDRPAIEITPAMVEAGVGAYVAARVEDWEETYSTSSQTVAAILEAGLTAGQ